MKNKIMKNKKLDSILSKGICGTTKFIGDGEILFDLKFRLSTTDESGRDINTIIEDTQTALKKFELSKKEFDDVQLFVCITLGKKAIDEEMIDSYYKD